MSKRRSSLKPLSLKIDFLGKKGKRKENISLAVRNSKKIKEEKACGSSTSNDDRQQDLDVFEDDYSQRATYESRKLTAYQKWTDLRQNLIKTAVSECCIPPDVVCCICHNDIAVIRCTFCGPQQFFCHSCAIELHSYRNYFHVMDFWKVSNLIVYIFVISFNIIKLVVVLFLFCLFLPVLYLITLIY